MTWNPFSSKNKKEVDAQSEGNNKPTQGKGRPTPKMKEAQSRNLHPLVPKDRKAEAKAAKQRMREREARYDEAMRTGDLSNMPPIERDPAHIYMRDYIDARFNVSEYFFFVMLAFMVILLVMTQWQALYMPMMIALYAYMLLCVLDLWFMWHKLKPRLIEKYGERSVAKGSHAFTYAMQRSMSPRGMRMPKPRSKKRGEWPK
jgi:Flp pilus assembly protein TadB